MRKSILMLAMFLLIGQLNAQLTTNWSFTSGGSNLPAWFGTGNTERGCGYSAFSQQFFVVVRNGGVVLRSFNSLTGADAASYDMTGVTGGTFTLNDVEASQTDSKVYGCNLATSNASAFKIYKWDNATTAPTVAFQYTAPVTGTRMGDNITYFGNNADNSAKFMFPDATRNMVFILKTMDNGNTFVLQDSIQLPANSFGGGPSTYPIINDLGVIEGVITNSSGKNVVAYNMQGQIIGTIPGSVIATGSTTVRAFRANDMFYIVTYQFGAGNENLRVVQVGDNPAYARSYVVSVPLGTNANANGTGDISFHVRPDQKVDLFILGTNNGIASYTMDFPFFVNGRFNEGYAFIGGSQNQNQGFGPNMALRRVGYAYDSNYVYVAVQTKLDKTNSNGMVVLLNFDNITGVPAGQALGGITGGGHLFGDQANPNWKMGFEVDMAFVINAGGNDSIAYLDAAKYFNGVKTGQYIGSAYNSGTGANGPSVAGIFAENAIRFALDSAYDNRRGFEIRIPKSELNNIGFSGNIQMAAFIVSNSAYFSDLSVPGNITGGNVGFNPDFGTVAGGPYYTGFSPLPVELVSFNATSTGTGIILDWMTASELNNRGFSVEKSLDGLNYSEIGFVAGNGTSALVNRYSYTDANAGAAVVYYRLKQIDFDGTYSYSSVVKVETSSVPSVFALDQNYPNPFNPSTTISFTVDKEGIANLTVYSVSGEMVATLFNESAKPGQRYNLQFKASDLPSGIYFYRLTQGNSVVTRKLTLLK